MDAKVMAAANHGINHETDYGYEHEKKRASKSHYMPLALSYEISQDQLDGRHLSVAVRELPRTYPSETESERLTDEGLRICLARGLKSFSAGKRTRYRPLRRIAR